MSVSKEKDGKPPWDVSEQKLKRPLETCYGVFQGFVPATSDIPSPSYYSIPFCYPTLLPAYITSAHSMRGYVLSLSPLSLPNETRVAPPVDD